MPQKRWLLLLVSCLSSPGCEATLPEDGPQVTVYLSSPEAGGMDYYDAEAKTSGFKTYDQTDHYVCFEPEDAKKVIQFYAEKKK